MKPVHISFAVLCRSIALSILVTCFCTGLSAQVITAKKDTTRSGVSFKSRLEPIPFSLQTQPAIFYQYRTPTNELMRWPNYPSTAAQMEERWKREEQNKKVVPYIVDQVVTSWINGKKRTGTAQPPQF